MCVFKEFNYILLQIKDVKFFFASFCYRITWRFVYTTLQQHARSKQTTILMRINLNIYAAVQLNSNNTSPTSLCVCWRHFMDKVKAISLYFANEDEDELKGKEVARNVKRPRSIEKKNL